MPNDDFVVLAIEGLCIGGAEVNLTNKGLGYIFLMKKKKGGEKQRFRAIRDVIFLPWVAAIREEVFLMDARNANISQTVCCKLVRWGHITGWCFQGESGNIF